MCNDNHMVFIKCIKCREDKEDKEYSLWRGKLNKTCKTCRSINNDWYQNDIDSRKTNAKIYYQRIKNKVARYRSDLRLNRKYNLTRSQWNDMFAKQNGLCGICDTKMENPVVDHDHKTGKVRGLLHKKCNLRLEVIEDEHFKLKAQNYLDSMK